MTSRALWMSGTYGLMIHYLPPLMEGRDGTRRTGVDAAAGAFDLARFLDAFDRSGARHLIFTLGQNTGLYNAPNPVIDHYAGPGHCPGRDLARELATALKRRGKRFLAYLPVELHGNPALQDGFGWRRIESKHEAALDAQETFCRRWRETIRHWAESLGTLLDGWWLDGCGWLALDPDSWRPALRAGNPDAAISFCYSDFSGGFVAPRSPGDDYFSGETFMLRDGLPRVGDGAGFRPGGAWVPGAESMLWHALVPVDAHWWRGASAEWCPFDGKRYAKPGTLRTGEMEPPMYTDDELRTLLSAFPGQGGAVTFNVGVFLDGTPGAATVSQLERLSKTFAGQPVAPPPQRLAEAGGMARREVPACR